MKKFLTAAALLASIALPAVASATDVDTFAALKLSKRYHDGTLAKDVAHVQTYLTVVRNDDGTTSMAWILHKFRYEGNMDAMRQYVTCYDNRAICKTESLN